MVASQLIDKLNAMQSGTESNRPPQSYSNNWGDDIKVEIPETGVSIGELRCFCTTGWGMIPISAAKSGAPRMASLSAFASSGSDGETLTGTEVDLDGLMQQAAEMSTHTQPYRYANYLDRNTLRPGAPLRVARAEAIYHRLIYDPNPVERAWAWNGLGNLAWTFHGERAGRGAGLREGERHCADYLKAAPTGQENTLSHPEAALALFRQRPAERRQGARTCERCRCDYCSLVGRLCRGISYLPYRRRTALQQYGLQPRLFAAQLCDGAGRNA